MSKEYTAKMLYTEARQNGDSPEKAALFVLDTLTMGTWVAFSKQTNDEAIKRVIRDYEPKYQAA